LRACRCRKRSPARVRCLRILSTQLATTAYAVGDGARFPDCAEKSIQVGFADADLRPVVRSSRPVAPGA
jgi:hypothetical protein